MSSFHNAPIFVLQSILALKGGVLGRGPLNYDQIKFSHVSFGHAKLLRRDCILIGKHLWPSQLVLFTDAQPVVAQNLKGYLWLRLFQKKKQKEKGSSLPLTH